MAKQQSDLVTKDYLDHRLTEFKQELKEELKEDLYAIKDEIVKEIRDMREVFDVHHASHIRVEFPSLEAAQKE